MAKGVHRSDLKVLRVRIEANEKFDSERNLRYQEKFEAQEKAVLEAKFNADKWRDNANEWRQTMSDKDRSFVTKNSLWAYFTAAIGIGISIATLVVKLH
jgi:hypothetical protein